MLSGGALATGGIDAQQDEKEKGESPQRGAAVAEEGEWDTDDWTQTYNHTYIDSDMEYEIAGYAISIDSSEHSRLALGYGYDTENKYHEKHQHEGRSHESFFLTYGTVDEVGVLLGYIF